MSINYSFNKEDFLAYNNIHEQKTNFESNLNVKNLLTQSKTPIYYFITNTLIK